MLSRIDKAVSERRKFAESSCLDSKLSSRQAGRKAQTDSALVLAKARLAVEWDGDNDAIVSMK